MEPQKIPNCQNNLEGKGKKAGGISLQEFRLCYKVTVVKTENYWHKNRDRSMNRIGCPKINSCICGHSVTEEEKIYMGEKIVSSTHGAWKTGQLH